MNLRKMYRLVKEVNSDPFWGIIFQTVILIYVWMTACYAIPTMLRYYFPPI